MTEHRLLTVRQPWATPIVDGKKDVENRGARFGLGYRGPLWIHAGAAWDDDGLASELVAGHYPRGATSGYRSDGFTLGAVIGRVHVLGAHRFEPGCCTSPWAVMEPGTTHLELGQARKVRGPVVAGALGIWHARRVHGLEITLRRLERDLDRQEVDPC